MDRSRQVCQILASCQRDRGQLGLDGGVGAGGRQLDSISSEAARCLTWLPPGRRARGSSAPKQPPRRTGLHFSGSVRWAAGLTPALAPYKGPGRTSSAGPSWAPWMSGSAPLGPQGRCRDPRQACTPIRALAGYQALCCELMSWRKLPSSWEADQNQRTQARVKPQPDRRHWGWARQ